MRDGASPVLLLPLALFLLLVGVQPAPAQPPPEDPSPAATSDTFVTDHPQLDPVPGPTPVGVGEVELQDVLREFREGEVPTGLRNTSLPLRVGDRAAEAASVRLPMDDQAADSDSSEGGEQGPAWVLPYRIITTGSSEEDVGYLRPVVDTTSGGVRYLGPERGFVGTVQLGVQDSLHPTERRPIETPVQFQLDSDADVVEPSRLTIEHTNLPFQEVEVSSRQPADSVAVRVRTSFDPGGVRLWIPVRRPTVELAVSPEVIPGWGLGSTDLLLDVGPTVQESGVSILLTAERGDPRPNRVTLEPGTEPRAVLRSTGVGVDTVTARRAGFPTVTREVTYRFPFRFLFAAVLGGAVGGILSGIGQRHRGTGVRLAIDGVEGILIGVLVAGAYPLGVNLLGVAFTAGYGEMLTFVLAGLGGFGGQNLLESRLGLTSRAGRGAPG